PSVAGTLGVLALLWFFVADFKVVPTNSMQPGIKPGDRLLVWLVGAHRVPQRFEVLVFVGPEENEVDAKGRVVRKPGTVLIKRVMGLPGERLAIEDGDLFVDGALVRKPDDLREAMREPLVRSRFDATGKGDDWAAASGEWRTYAKPLFADEPLYVDELGRMDAARPPREAGRDVYRA